MANGLIGLRAALYGGAGAEPVTFIPAAGAATVLRAIRENTSAGDLPGPGNLLRSVTFEIAQVDLPVKPVRGDVLTAGAETWRVDQVVALDHLGAWQVWVRT